MNQYTRITEELRAEILEDGTVTEEAVCMLWLLRESGCMHDLFSRNELERVGTRMDELYSESALARTLFPIPIHKRSELIIKQLLHMKKMAVKTQVGRGLNFVFPIIERSQSVFIETEEMFAGPDQRIRDVITRLESYGHVVKVIRGGQVPIIKIDNICYEAHPHAAYTRVPIHGVRLQPKRPAAVV